MVPYRNGTYMYLLAPCPSSVLPTGTYRITSIMIVRFHSSSYFSPLFHLFPPSSSSPSHSTTFSSHARALFFSFPLHSILTLAFPRYFNPFLLPDTSGRASVADGLDVAPRAPMIFLAPGSNQIVALSHIFCSACPHMPSSHSQSLKR